MKVEVSKGNKRKKLSFEFTEIEVRRKNKRGKMVFEFMEVDEFNICKHSCPYGLNVCLNIPDPRYGLKDNYRFSDFCSEMGIDKNLNIVPTSGSLERYYGRVIEKIKLGIKT